MKSYILFFAIFIPILLFGQINESFSDGDFTKNPEWTGTSQNFIINASGQLQSNASSTSVSYLFTPSEAIINASWECSLKINYTTSSSNYSSVYIISDNNDILNGCNGYYVQIGGTNDEVSLFLQEGTKKTKIIDGADKRTDGNSVDIKIRVTRDIVGNFELFSKLPAETNYVSEGKVLNKVVTTSQYFGLLFSNTTTTGLAYFFDDILVSGEKIPDTEAPTTTDIRIEEPNKIVLSFSEKMNYSQSHFEVDNGIGDALQVQISSDLKTVTLVFNKNFEKGQLYTLYLSGLSDLSGNNLLIQQLIVGIPENTAQGDIVWNEIMFENPQNSVEYLEIFNKSNKILNISGLVFTTRKTNGTLNTGNKLPEHTLLEPGGYLAFCSHPDSLKRYYNLSADSRIIQTSWSVLNNESATVVLCNSNKDTIYDELTYNSKWHHALVKNPKGVALEKINPLLQTQNTASWHSAGSDVNYGTPGYKNSQYRDIDTAIDNAEFFRIEPEAFSPDMDGIDDICFIRYKTETNGYVANVIILNAAGEKICRIASNILLSSEGYLAWDGRTDKGLNANVGIYVAYIEAFNPTTGDKKIEKLPVVVTSR